MSLIEARAAGVPSWENWGGCPGLSGMVDSGILVPPEDEAAFAGALRQLLLDRELAARFGSGRGAARVKTLFGRSLGRGTSMFCIDSCCRRRREDLVGGYAGSPSIANSLGEGPKGRDRAERDFSIERWRPVILRTEGCRCAALRLRASDANAHAAAVLAESLANRGPDGDGPPQSSFTLVQTRLSVIDLSDRVQYPMPNETVMSGCSSTERSTDTAGCGGS